MPPGGRPYGNALCRYNSKLSAKHRDLVGDDAVREFTEEGGTIGRSLTNDWILPDPDRYISGRTRRSTTRAASTTSST